MAIVHRKTEKRKQSGGARKKEERSKYEPTQRFKSSKSLPEWTNIQTQDAWASKKRSIKVGLATKEGALPAREITGFLLSTQESLRLTI
jgi:hypothetical protein